MSETQHEDLFNDGSQTPAGTPQGGPAQLRDAYEKAQARIADQQKQIDELQGFRRNTVVKDFVKDKGLPEKAIGLIGDKDPDEWYKEFGELFTPAGNESPAEQEAETTTTTPVGQGALTPEEQAAIAAVGSVQAGTFQPGSTAEVDSKLDSLESTAKSPEDFYAGLRDMGAAT
jgi:hypothetical protein